MVHRYASGIGVVVCAAILVAAIGCSASKTNGQAPSDRLDDSSVEATDLEGGLDLDGGGLNVDGDFGYPRGNCTNLQCRQYKCPSGTTSVSGTVFAGTQPKYGSPDPVYNAIVYVPNSTPQPFSPGVSCDKCGTPASGDPIVVALTGYDGTFRLDNPPVGANVPLVIQIGRWRRQITIPNVEKCTDTSLPADLTRLPRNKTEGDIPLTAIVSSTFDPSECILRKMGVDDAEFSLPLDGGRIHLFKGTGANMGPDTPSGHILWDKLDNLKKYDLVLLPCESHPKYLEDSGASATFPDATKNVMDYANAGGRIFATDLSFPWLSEAPEPWASLAPWTAPGAVWGNITATIDESFPKGKALAKWLQATSASTTEGSIPLVDTYARTSGVNSPAQRWMYSPTTVQHFTFNAPANVDAKDQCGRVVYSSFHIAHAGGSGTWPSECTNAPLTPQEKVLEFMLFDLASCVQLDTKVPAPPPIK